MMAQGIRDFVAAYEQAFPGEVVRVTEPVTTDFDVMALVLEYERRRRDAWPRSTPGASRTRSSPRCWRARPSTSAC
jgi:hypothetical protein